MGQKTRKTEFSYQKKAIRMRRKKIEANITLLYDGKGHQRFL